MSKWLSRNVCMPHMLVQLKYLDSIFTKTKPSLTVFYCKISHMHVLVVLVLDLHNPGLLGSLITLH